MRVDVGGRLRNVIAPLGTRTHAIIGPERIYIGDNASYDIHIFDFDGRRVGSARSARPATPVTSGDLAAYRERAQVANAGDDWVLAEHVDDLDVPSVRLHDLTTGGAARR